MYDECGSVSDDDNCPENEAILALEWVSPRRASGAVNDDDAYPPRTALGLPR
jgi:hypothetical protein